MNDTRHTLSFDIVGLPAREAILLKSFIRMLNSRTHQQWLYSGNPESQAAGLTFLAEDHLISDQAAAGKQMRLGSPELGLFATLSRPLHTEQLESELNRLGDLVVQERTGVRVEARQSVQDTMPAPLPELRPEPVSASAPPASAMALASLISPPPGAERQVSLPVNAAPFVMPQPKAQQAAAPALQHGHQQALQQAPQQELYRLLRWPHTSVLTTPARGKLAAFMLGSPLALQTLHQRSGQSLADCQAFVDDLKRNGFVASVTSNAAADPLFGSFQPAAAAPVARPAAAPHKSPPALTSLFGRIRKRLGIAPPQQSWTSSGMGQLK